jgi:hypothetical protein
MNSLPKVKLIIPGGFMVEIGAHESEASNLLKLNYKINDKLVCCFLDLGTINLFIIMKVAQQLGVKTKLVGFHHGAINTRHK